MGYTSYFDGSVTVTPPLNPTEVTYLRAFSETRRMDRTRGPYFVLGTGYHGQAREADVREYNRPPAGQPGLWCQWLPSEDGLTIEWDEGKKFYDSEEWMVYLIDHFLKPGAEAFKSSDPQFNEFTFDHVVSGTIYVQGEDSEDHWRIVVKDNVVMSEQAITVWPSDQAKTEV